MLYLSSFIILDYPVLSMIFFCRPCPLKSTWVGNTCGFGWKYGTPKFAGWWFLFPLNWLFCVCPKILLDIVIPKIWWLIIPENVP